MAREVNNQEINSQCAELLLRPTYKGNTWCNILQNASQQQSVLQKLK